MKIKLVVFVSVISSFLMIIAMVALGAFAGKVFAQNPNPPTGERSPLTTSHDNTILADRPDEGKSVSATWSYYFILGNQLIPFGKNSSTIYTNNTSLGCMSLMGINSAGASFPLNIPQGSVIKYVRIYYIDNSYINDMTVSLTTYSDPGGSIVYTHLVRVKSTGYAGSGTALSSEITHTFDNTIPYSIFYTQEEMDGNLQICGVRIAYYAPTLYGQFLPSIQKNATTP